MMNPINEMRRLSNKSFEELKHLAIGVFGSFPDIKCSKVELITYIVAQEYVHDNIAEKIAHPEKNSGRKKYQITTVDNETYYVKLTSEQTKFLEWCLENEVCFSDANARELEDIEWDTP